MCLASLLLSIRPGNCIALLSAAYTAGCSELERSAARACLQDLPAAAEVDAFSFGQLPRSLLQALLSQDSLRCSEGEVLLLLVRWAEADATARLPMLREIGGSVVRPSQLSLTMLEELDQHPAVSKSREAIEMVAGLFIQHIMDSAPVSAHDRPRVAREK